MKLIYIASPYRGDTKKNVAFAKEACKYAINEGNNVYCPHLFLTDILDDDIPTEREMGIALGKDMMLNCDELWVFGDRISEGMLGEIEFARANEIPIERHVSFEYQQSIKPQTLDLEESNHAYTTLSDYEFTPSNFEVQDKIYGNTGGGCMVATVKFYLPEIEKNVWINCTDESIGISSTDYMWNEDNSNSYDDHENAVLLNINLEDDKPSKAEQWLPMIQQALLYTIEQEVKYYKHGTFELPVAWIPDSIRDTINPEYLEWAESEEKKVSIAENNQVEMDEEYQPSIKPQAFEQRLC